MKQIPINYAIRFFTMALPVILAIPNVHAAVALDRTRVIFDGSQTSMSVNIRNDNQKMPYLAQAWVEDKEGNKIREPLMALPPLQRLEPGAKSMVKLQLSPGAKLPQDKESLFFFNLREIPPKSKKSNVMQLALQTRVKLFYRPAALMENKENATTPWQEKITLTRQGDRYQANNPTPYFITLVADGESDMQPLMLAPQSSAALGVKASAMGAQPHLAYINDWGGRPVLKFSCSGNSCKVIENKATK